MAGDDGVALERRKRIQNCQNPAEIGCLASAMRSGKYQIAGKHQAPFRQINDQIAPAVAMAHENEFDFFTPWGDGGLPVYADLREGLAERQQRAEVKRALAAGDEHFNQGDFAAALKEYQAGLPLVPESSKPLMWIQIAKTHAELNQLDEAVQAYRQAIQLAPDNSEYPEALVSHYLAQEQSREAIEIYADLFAKRSEPVAEGLFAKGQEFGRKAKPEMAQAAYEKVLEVDPEYAEAVYELGMVYFYDVKDNARSREMLTRYLAMGKDAAHVSNAESVLAVMK